MSRVSPEMLQCVQTPENGTDLSVLERQRARMKWYQQQQQQHHQNAQQAEQSEFSDTHLNVLQFQSGLVNNDAILVKSDPDFHNGYTGLEKYPIPVAEEEYNGSVEIDSGKMASSLGRANTKKRKADKAQSHKIVGAEETNEKRMKKVTEQSNNREHSGDNSRENSKVSEAQKPDYIHVRARRGQATDSHSLAERVRREKISERMKYLQDLVPGCNKVIGKAGMLDEIINYVQSLQKQVEFLSMKLAAVNPRLDFNIEDFFNKEMFPSCANSFPTIGMLSEVANPSYLHFNHVQQVISCCGVDVGINPPEMALERTTSSAVSVPETFLDPSYFSHTQQASVWESDLQSIYNIAFNQGRSTSFPSQSFTGTLAANNLKMEM